MTKPEIEKLIDRYLRGDATPEETDLVERFYDRLAGREADWEVWEAAAKKELGARLYRKIRQKTKKPQSRKLWLWIPAAAAALILLITTFLLPDQYRSGDATELPAITEKTITATAEQRSILLSDGTYVLLSPGASLIFPSSFEEETREVRLEGEAWFDVQRDSLHPFRVLAGGVITTVLGTSFSINAHPEDTKVEVKVTSGRVQVNSEEKELAVLEKDDQLEYASGEYTVLREEAEDLRTVPLPRPGVWKLSDVTMTEATAFVSKRWDREIVFENPEIGDCPLYASFNADDSMEEVLTILCGVSRSEYKTEDGVIKIFGAGCHQ